MIPYQDTQMYRFPFGAGVPTVCVVDVSAEKTSITWVVEGPCITDSGANMKYGGDDVTVTLSQLYLKNSLGSPICDLMNALNKTLRGKLR